jgi:osmotically-inducible protein OsmY
MTNDIRAAVEDDLTFDPDIDPSDITVKAAGGEVTLSGSVPSYPQYVEAAAVAHRVPGVGFVHNRLAVVLPPGDYRSDQTLVTMANDALTLDHEAAVGVVGVTATAENGDITLTGTARSGRERAAAELLVAGLTGVRHVTNDIQVRDLADGWGS